MPVLKVNERYVSGPKCVAESLAKHFANVSSAAHYYHEFQQFRLSASVVPPVSDNMEAFNLPFSMDEMMTALSSSSLTSPGEDSSYQI